MEQEITNLLRELATQLGTTTEYLWAVMVKQAYVYVWIRVAYCLLTVPFLIGTYKGINLVRKKICDNKWDEIAWLPMVVIALVVGGVSMSIWSNGLYYIITGVFNPEYLALNKVLTILK